MYKQSILVLILITSSVLAFGQEHESVLSAPDNWKSEQFTFPIGFAPSIDFVGFEDLRFSPGWSDTGNPEFWTYTFVWYVEKKDSSFTESSLAKNLEIYFDGLMKIDSRNTEGSTQLQKTLSVFIKTNEGFKGKIRVYDAFFTKKEMTLHVKVKEAFCAESNKQMILFELSPKGFDDPVWGIFNAIKLTVKCD